MNLKAVVPLVLAVVLGLVAAVLVRNAIVHKGASTTTPSNLVAVVVAKQDVQPGKALGAEDLIVSKVPADVAPGKVYSDPNQLMGRVVTIPLAKGQTILDTLLAPTGTGAGLQALVPPGMRAITLEISEFSGVGGMLMPGCHVDLISIVHDQKSSEQVARTILQNIKIQAVGRTMSAAPPVEGPNGAPPPGPANNITLLCTPKQAQIIQLSTTAGRPWIVLRSSQDGRELPVEGTTMAELRGENDSASADASTPIGTEIPSHPGAGTDMFGPTNLTPAGATPAPVATDSPSPTMKRTVQILRGGNESQVTFVVPNPRAATADLPTN